ncbi:MAG: extracellular solute-binding protein [Phycisphaerales bacterium]
MRKSLSFLSSSYLSPGSAVVLLIAVISSVVFVAWPIQKQPGLEFWTFSKNHAKMYAQQIEIWNKQADAVGGQPRVNLFVIQMTALVRRTLSAFWSDTPVADIIEVEGNTIGRFVAGPIEDVGFVDLTDRLHEEGIYDQINPPSFSPWTSRGRVFGLPHDVHPVLLCYRADIVEEAGIDVNEIETWDDFARVLAPLIKDLDGDGRPDRYLLNIWYSSTEWIEPLMLQAGGGTFDESEELIVSSEANGV